MKIKTKMFVFLMLSFVAFEIWPFRLGSCEQKKHAQKITEEQVSRIKNETILDKQTDRYYNFGLQLSYHALKSTYKNHFSDTDITNEILEQENKKLLEEYWQEITQLCKKDKEQHAATEKVSDKFFLGLIKIFETPQLFGEALQKIGCPIEKAKKIIESGICEKFLYSTSEGMKATITRLFLLG